MNPDNDDSLRCALCDCPALGSFFLAPGSRRSIILCGRCQTDLRATEEPLRKRTVPNTFLNSLRMAYLKGRFNAVLAAEFVGVESYTIRNFWDGETKQARSFWTKWKPVPRQQQGEHTWSMLPPTEPGWYWFDSFADDSIKPALAYPAVPDGPTPLLLVTHPDGFLEIWNSGCRVTEAKGLWWSLPLRAPKSL